MKRLRVTLCLGMFFVFLCLAGYAIGQLVGHSIEAKRQEKDFTELRDMINPIASERYIQVDGKQILRRFESLYEKNSDIVGWLTIEDTNIDYPVMQTVQEEGYYLTHNFEKEESSAGVPFFNATADVEDLSTISIIYGHNMKNGSMFANLLKYEDEGFYRTHKYITFSTIYKESTYEVIAAFRTQITDKEGEFCYYAPIGEDDKDAFEDYVRNITDMTPYQMDATAAHGDSLIVLSTCAYHVTDGRFVVVMKSLPH